MILENKRKGSQRELKRDTCEINCREVVFEVAFNNFWPKLSPFNFMHKKKYFF